MDTKTIALKSTGTDILVHHGGPRITDPPNVCDGYTIAYAAHSPGTLDIDGETVQNVNENDVFLIAPYTPFRFLPIKGLRRMDVYFCFFSADALSDRLLTVLTEQFAGFRGMTDGRSLYIAASNAAPHEIRDILIRMIDEDISALPCFADVIKGFLPVLLIKLLRAAETPAETPRSNLTGEAIRYINRHMYEKISLAAIAEHLKLSPYYVSHRFKSETGKTVSEFINYVRTEKIKDILANTSKPVKTIPQMFNCSPEHLKRTFRKCVGMSMTEYRDRYNYKRMGSGTDAEDV